MDSSLTIDDNKDVPTPSTSKDQQQKPDHENVITENVPVKRQLLTKSCVVSIEPLHVPTSSPVNNVPENNNGYNMHSRPPKPQLSQRTSECPWQ